MKVGFYVNNSQFPNTDCRNVINGNPGIGGTWHLFLIAASELSRRKNGIDVLMYVQVKNEYLPQGMKIKVVKDTIESIYQADKDELDYIVVNTTNVKWNKFVFSDLNSKVKIIPWCHNFVPIRDLNILSNNARIARIINVGKEQMDLYRDHPSFIKMDYIYNCIPIDNELIINVSNNINKSRSHIVTYMGSLVPQKNFHVLASIWPEILSAVPDAHLFVIGDGKLYHKDALLGKYGIAEESYERKFMPYLTDSNGKVLENVHFMGSMGHEKNEILLKTKVGVPNPTGSGETFCLSVVEMQALGCRVTAMRSPGYYDTIINGKLSYSKKQLLNNIISLLTDDNHNSYDMTLGLIKEKFSIDTFISDWEKLFYGKCSTYIHPIYPLTNHNYHLKWLKESIRTIKLKNPNINILPCLEYFIIQYQRIKHKLNICFSFM